MRRMILNVVSVVLVSSPPLASKFFCSILETIICSSFWKNSIGLPKRSLCFFWKQCKSFYGFIPLFEVLSTGNALRPIDRWSDNIEFSDIHYYVEYSFCPFIYVKWLHLQIHLSCTERFVSDVILEFGLLQMTFLVVVICCLFLPPWWFNKQL